MKQLTGAELAELYGYGTRRAPARRSTDPYARLRAADGRIVDDPARWRSTADPRRVAAVTGVMVVLGLEVAASIASQHFTPFPWSVALAAVLGWSIRTLSSRRGRRARL